MDKSKIISVIITLLAIILGLFYISSSTEDIEQAKKYSYTQKN